MWSDLARACRGAAVSAFRPARGADPVRLRRHIDSLATKRGVPSWFDRFAPSEIEGAAGALHLDTVEAASPLGTVVFMPGTNAYALLYGELLLALADRGWNVAAFDPRGHGRSEGGRGSYTMDELLQDYQCVVAHVRNTRPGPLVVSGSSQGGIIALYYALSDSSVEAAVCHNVADLSDPSSVELTRLRERARRARPLIDWLGTWLPELPVPMQAYLDLRREPVRGEPHALQVLLEDPLIPWFVRTKTLASLGSASPPAPFESLDVPVLVLQAGADTIFPTSYVTRMAERLPRATLEVFEGLPHYMVVDHVDTVVPVIADWLRRQVLRI